MLNTLNAIGEERRLRYYDLCLTNKDWGRGVLREALDFIEAHHTRGDVHDMLEVGSGVGDIVPQLPRGVRYTGLDPTEYGVAESKRLYPQQSFVVGCAEELPFPDESFDLVYSFQTIQMVRDPQRALREIARVIRPGGYALLLSPNLECPWSMSHSVQHYSIVQHFVLTCGRFFDLALRFFGVSSFRTIPKTYAETTGHYDGKDYDLKYLVSTWEVTRLFRACGFQDIATKKSERPWMRLIGPLRYYRGGMYLLMQKQL